MDVLTTERLTLRPWRDDAVDLDAYAAMAADPDVMRYIGDGRPRTREEAAAGLGGLLGHWERHGHGLYALVARGDGEDRAGSPAAGEVLGYAGLVRAGEPGVRPGDVEIGWRLARRHWGRGYATEAALAAREHAFETLRLARLVSLIRPANAASIGVARKLGMELEQERRCSRGLPLRIYALDHPAVRAGAAAR